MPALCSMCCLPSRDVHSPSIYSEAERDVAAQMRIEPYGGGAPQDSSVPQVGELT